ncbi:MAG: hypothetical protein QNK04_30900 [Myxococcota bacterium]|nr:hypothetical protein [Myxococcota bacterium]
MSARALVAGAGIAALFLAHAFFLGGVAEDAFISFRFARNLAAGQGLVWNVGDPPVEGYTNFLWMLCSALWIRAGVDPVLGAQALGVVAALATLVVTWRCGRLLGWGDAALMPPLFLALTGPFCAWSTGGLETSAFAALLAFAAFHLARSVQETRPADPWIGSFFLLLAMLTRPEGAVAAAALAVPGVWLARRRPALGRRLVAPALACLGLFALYFAWRWSYFGQLLPNTFYAKTGGGLPQWLRGARYAGWFALHYLLPWLPVLLLAGLARGPGAVLREPVLGLSALLLAVLSAAVVWEGGDYMAMYRFFVPVLPFLALFLGAAVLRAATAPPRAALGAALAVAVLGTALHSTPLEARWLPEMAGLHGNWRGVRTERWHVARLTAIGDFFAREAGPGESLATDAIGAIGWRARDLRVYGAHGLVDPELARRPERRVGLGVAGHDRLDFAVLLARRPTFLMFRRDLRAQPLRRLELNVGVDEGLADEYQLRAVWIEDPANGEAGWFSFLERRDRAAPTEAGSRPNGV